MRIAFLSERNLVDPDRCDYGLYRRMGLLIDVVKGIGEVDGLIMVRHHSSEAVQRYCVNLSRRWGVRIRCISANRCSAPRLIAEACNGVAITVPSSGQDLAGDYAAFSPEQIREYLRKYDAVFAHRMESMRWLLPSETLPPILFDLDDLEHVKLIRTTKWIRGIWAKARLIMKIARTLISEYAAVRASNRTFVCSERDRRTLVRLLGLGNVSVIPNCVDVTPRYVFQPNKVLLYLGTYLYWPNVQAAEFMIAEIWPLVLARVPDARLLIGGWPPERIRFHARPPQAVEFTGYVENLEILYTGVRAVCCPILVAGGTRIKIIEAAAYGKAIVSTTVGAEGLDFQDGIHLLVKDGPEDLAEACAAVLLDDELCQRLGIEARKKVALAYDRSLVVERAREEILSSLSRV